MQLLGPNDFKTMPWKNGGGITRELYIDHEGESRPGEFRLRISIAHVAASGPFSKFPGYDRLIMQIAGGPMALQHEARLKTLELWEPYQFSGDIETVGIVTGQDTQDFNVITRRSYGQARLNVLVGIVKTAVTGRWFVYAHTGTADVAFGDQTLHVPQGHLLVGSGTAMIVSEMAKLFVITFNAGN